jgi:DNA polymerase III subunit gamma/tau
LREDHDAREQVMRSEAAQDPLVRAVLDAFPGARIEAVREIEEASPAPAAPDEESEGDEA